MNYLVTRLNHNTAPVDIREQAAMTGDALPEALRYLSQEPGVNEAMIVSTCNRVELVGMLPCRSSSVRIWQPLCACGTWPTETEKDTGRWSSNPCVKTLVQLHADRIGGIQRPRDANQHLRQIPVDAPVVRVVSISQGRAHHAAA